MSEVIRFVDYGRWAGQKWAEYLPLWAGHVCLEGPWRTHRIACNANNSAKQVLITATGIDNRNATANELRMHLTHVAHRRNRVRLLRLHRQRYLLIVLSHPSWLGKPRRLSSCQLWIVGCDTATCSPTSLQVGSSDSIGGAANRCWINTRPVVLSGTFFMRWWGVIWCKANALYGLFYLGLRDSQVRDGL